MKHLFLGLIALFVISACDNSVLEQTGSNRQEYVANLTPNVTYPLQSQSTRSALTECSEQVILTYATLAA